MLQEGDPAPEFELLDQDGKKVTSKSLKGKKILIYSYPKANTPGCTKEAVNFQSTLDGYKEKGVQIIGVSRDTVNAQKKFADKYNLEFPLLSDKDGDLLGKLGSLAGGRIKRRTWLIDEDWKIEKFWDNVSPTKHNEEVCAFCGIQLPEL